MGKKQAACDQYSNIFPSASSSSSQRGYDAQRGASPNLLHSTRYGLRATTWIVSICNAPILRMRSRTSSLVAGYPLGACGHLSRPITASIRLFAAVVESCMVVSESVNIGGLQGYISALLTQGLHVHRLGDACDLLDVRSLMGSQPLRIGQHGPLEYPSRPRHRRRPYPRLMRQVFQH